MSFGTCWSFGKLTVLMGMQGGKYHENSISHTVNEQTGWGCVSFCCHVSRVWMGKLNSSRQQKNPDCQSISFTSLSHANLSHRRLNIQPKRTIPIPFLSQVELFCFLRSCSLTNLVVLIILLHILGHDLRALCKGLFLQVIGTITHGYWWCGLIPKLPELWRQQTHL